jgi:hypothetical protein
MKTFKVTAGSGLLAKAGILVKAKSALKLAKRLGDVTFVVVIKEVKK